MSFFKVLCALLKASPAKLVFPDEAKAKEAFLARYGEECDQQGLEDGAGGGITSCEQQLRVAAQVLDCKVLVFKEVVSGTMRTLDKTLNPGGSLRVAVRWKTADRQEVIGFGPTHTREITAPYSFLDAVGWDSFLKVLMHCEGDFQEALNTMYDKTTEKVTDPDTTAEQIAVLNSTIDIITDYWSSRKDVVEEEELAEVVEPARVVVEKTTMPTFAEIVASKKTTVTGRPKESETHTLVSKSSAELEVLSAKVSSLEECLRKFTAVAAMPSSSNVTNSISFQWPTIDLINLANWRKYREKFEEQLRKTNGAGGSQLHPLRGLTKTASNVVQNLWDFSPNCNAHGPFSASTEVDAKLWLKEIEESLRLSERAPKLQAGELILEKPKNLLDLPQAWNKFSTRVLEYFKEGGSHLTSEKKFDLLVKGIKKNFADKASFLQDTVIPTKTAERSLEGKEFTAEEAVFILRNDFLSKLSVATSTTDKDSEDDEECDEANSKQRKRLKEKKKKKKDVSTLNSQINFGSEKGNLGKRKLEDKDNKSNSGCYICKDPGHKMADCPKAKNNQDAEKKSKTARFNMMLNVRTAGIEKWFSGEFKLYPNSPSKAAPLLGQVAYDTCAEDNSFCSEELVVKAQSLGYSMVKEDLTVRLADGSTEVQCTGFLYLPITLLFESCGRSNKMVNIKLFVIPNHEYLITIGAPEVVANDLLPDLMALVAAKKASQHRYMLGGAKSVLRSEKEGKESGGVKIATVHNTPPANSTEAKVGGAAPTSQPQLVPTSGNNKGDEAVGASMPDKRATEVATASTIPKCSLEETEGGFVLKAPPEVDDGIDVPGVFPEFFGDKAFHKISWVGIRNAFAKNIVAAITKFEDVFSDRVDKEPCLLEPYEIIIKNELKGSFPPKEMRQAVRPQTPANEAAIKAKLETWEEMGIIKKVSSTFWSQIHVANKEGKSPRICIDWKALNTFVEVFQWPIPDIKKTLPTLRNKKYFATIDLTDAYQQLAMATNSVKYTAFRTAIAIYVMTRLGFGHAGAVAHFQKEMTLKVLEGLTGVICHSYLDDVIAWGDTEEELIANLIMILMRFRKFKIKAKASKLKIGSSLTFLGHIIESMGMSMSDDRKAALVKIQRPTTVRELHVFLGTANFFRDFVSKHSMFTQRLTKMLTPNLRAKLEWSKEATADFESLKKAILDAPILWWLQEGLLTGISTDASVFCWGGYLWQIDKDGKERIILFVSGTFSGAQLSWPINEKEMYAVVAVVAKVKYLIGTMKFTIKIDHKNLQYISQPSKSDKIERYKLYLSRFAHVFEVIPGEDNTVADGMSRLMGLRVSRLCGIREIHQSLIREFHGGLAGHRGVEATLQKLKETGHSWSSVEEDVKGFVESCPICQVVKPNSNKRGHGQTFEIICKEEHEVVAMDTMGPLDEDSQGYKHIIALVDEFSRYAVLTPAKSTDAKEAAQVILNYCCVWGIPKSFKSDRGSQFNNELVKELLSSLGSNFNLIPVGSSEENGIVERSFRNLRNDLAGFVREDKDADWSTKIKLVERIMNSTANGTTKVVPADLRLGRKQALDINLLVTSTTSHAGETPASRESVVKSRTLVYTNLAKSISERLENHLQRQMKFRIETPTLFSPSTWVFLEEKTRKGDPSGTRRQGPYQVVRQQGNAVTVLCNEKERVVPVSVCVAFVSGQIAPERLQAENSESAETRFFVEKIVSHKFTGKTPTVANTTLEVKWVGYKGTTEEKLCDNRDLRQTEALVQYVQRHPELIGLVEKSVRPAIDEASER